MNSNNHMDLNDTSLVRSLGPQSQDALKLKEHNNYGKYELMINKHGRQVPIALELVDQKLRLGYIRTDAKVYEDVKEDRVRAPIAESDPTKAMAKLAESIDGSIKEIAKRRTRKKVSKDAEKEV